MKTEPNKAMEPTPVSVTDHAPSSMLRATYLRGSSCALGRIMNRYAALLAIALTGCASTQHADNQHTSTSIMSSPKAEYFVPNFPIIPLYATETEARSVLEKHGPVQIEEPGSDRTIADHLLAAETSETRIVVGIMNGRVRFTHYWTIHFNEDDERKGRKLGWFAKYYGGASEFEEPWENGYTVFWKNPVKKILIVFGMHMGPVRIIDQDPEHWPKINEN